MKKSLLFILLTCILNACTLEQNGKAPSLEEFRIFNRTTGSNEVFGVGEKLHLFLEVQADPNGPTARQLEKGLFSYHVNGIPGDTLAQLTEVFEGWSVFHILSLDHLKLSGTPYVAQEADRIQFFVATEDTEGNQLLFEEEIIISP